jgi:predicted ester cyclase
MDLPMRMAIQLQAAKVSSRFSGKFIESFPDLHIEVQDMIEEGDKVAARCLVTMSHKGKDFSVGPKILASNPTSTPISFTGIVISTIKDGKIAEAWNNWDFMSLYMQMGVLQMA